MISFCRALSRRQNGIEIDDGLSSRILSYLDLYGAFLDKVYALPAHI